MITKSEPVYTNKEYCTECKHLFDVYSSSCQLCGCYHTSTLKVDERYAAMVQFRATRSMKQYKSQMEKANDSF